MKQKTHSGAKKRVRRTGSGKLRMEKSSKRHLLVNKSKRQKNLGGRKFLLSPGDAKQIERMLTR